MTHSDHVALAISRPGTLYDYQWYNTTLPEQFLGNYLEFADQDFVRKAVAAKPNEVVRDQEMISRTALERHVVYQSALSAGARLEQVMAVMLSHEQEWSSGLSLYRERTRAFSDRDAEVLKLAVPMIRATVQNSRRFDEAHRSALMASTMESAHMPALWLDGRGNEVTRTEAATRVLQHFFSARERTRGVPEALLLPLRRMAHAKTPMVAPEEMVRAREVNCLRVRYARVYHPHSGEPLWAALLDVRGIPLEKEALLSRREREVVGMIMRGMSAPQIANFQGRALSTIKQQSKDAFAALNVDGKNGLLALISGFQVDTALGVGSDDLAPG